MTTINNVTYREETITQTMTLQPNAWTMVGWYVEITDFNSQIYGEFGTDVTDVWSIDPNSQGGPYGGVWSLQNVQQGLGFLNSLDAVTPVLPFWVKTGASISGTYTFTGRSVESMDLTFGANGWVNYFNYPFATTRTFASENMETGDALTAFNEIKVNSGPNSGVWSTSNLPMLGFLNSVQGFIVGYGHVVLMNPRPSTAPNTETFNLVLTNQDPDTSSPPATLEKLNNETLLKGLSIQSGVNNNDSNSWKIFAHLPIGTQITDVNQLMYPNNNWRTLFYARNASSTNSPVVPTSAQFVLFQGFNATDGIFSPTFNASDMFYQVVTPESNSGDTGGGSNLVEVRYDNLSFVYTPTDMYPDTSLGNANVTRVRVRINNFSNNKNYYIASFNIDFGEKVYLDDAQVTINNNSLPHNYNVYQIEDTS